MPARTAAEIVTLGEGGTPLLRADRLGAAHGMPNLYIKEEAGNPTGSFKARGLGAAVTMAKALGAKKIALPTAGNAGGAAAAYAAKAGLECHVFMPKDTPKVFRIECEAYGAKVGLVDGLIDACGRIVARAQGRRGLVRRVDAQGAVPRRGQEDHGLRDRRAARMVAARRRRLPDGRRHGPHRDVEGVRRDGGARLDRAGAPAHGLGPGRGLRADPEGVRGRQGRLRELRERAHVRVRAARPEGLRGLSDPEDPPRLEGGGRHRDGRRDAPRRRRARLARGPLRRARGRRRVGSRQEARRAGEGRRRTSASSSSTRGPATNTSSDAAVSEGRASPWRRRASRRSAPGASHPGTRPRPLRPSRLPTATCG